jgi:hypothetical protein
MLRVAGGTLTANDDVGEVRREVMSGDLMSVALVSGEWGPDAGRECCAVDDEFEGSQDVDFV